MKIKLTTGEIVEVNTMSTPHTIILKNPTDIDKFTAESVKHIEFITIYDGKEIVYGKYDNTEPNIYTSERTVYYHGDIVPCKQYVTVSGAIVTDGFSDAFRQPAEDDIYIGDGKRDFELMGEINPPLIGSDGCHIYRYDGSVRKATESELAEEKAAQPQPEPQGQAVEERVSDNEDYIAELLYNQCMMQLGLEEV